MPNYLQIVQDTVRESGTVSSLPAPSSVVGQSGRLDRFTYWVRRAYEDIQRHRDDWRWLNAEFAGQTLAGVQRYDASAMGITDRFAHWMYYGWDEPEQWTIYKTSEGRGHEGYLPFIPWDTFRRTALMGLTAETTGRPACFTIDPQDKIALHPMPDAEYTIRGMYYRAPQVLAIDTDIPEMPARFHIAIQWKALMLMAAFDEAGEQMPVWNEEYRRSLAQLALTQLPRMKLGGPIER